MADRRIRINMGPTQLAAVLDALKHRQGDMHLPHPASAYQAAEATLLAALEAHEVRRLHRQERD